MMDGQTFRSSIRISLYVCSQRRRWSEEREVRPRGTGPRVTLTPIIWKTPDANFKCSEDQSLLGKVLHGSWQLCSRAFRKLHKLLTELQRREETPHAVHQETNRLSPVTHYRFLCSVTV